MQSDAAPEVCGLIQRIYLENFLCHSRLELNLGHNINFIAGKNGSGKSAIFTAAQVVLGSRAGTTNRGSSLQSMIKTGESRALIEITLKNDGTGAYLPNVYGPSIIVSRTILSSGGGAYKISDSNGRLVSNKKKDLQNILLKLNIQVDNPLCILSQDASREFLKSNSDSKRYELFYRATLLEQLKLERNKIADDLKVAKKALGEKLESLEEFKKDVEHWESQVKLIQTLYDSKAKLDILRGELAWAQVRGLESETITLKASYEKEEHKVNQLADHIATLRTALKEAEDELKLLQGEVQDTDSQLSTLRAEQREKEIALRRGRELHRTSIHENRELDAKLVSLQKEVTELTIAIENLRKTDYEEFGRRKAEREERMRNLEQQKAAIISQRRTGDHHFNQLKSALNIAKQQLDTLREDDREIQRKISDKHRRLGELKNTTSNQLSVFGAFVPRLLEQFKTAGFKKTPKGPIGAFVKVRDHSYGSLVENRLGKILCGYVVDNDGDAIILKRLLSNVNPRPTIFTNELGRKRYDIEQGSVAASSGYARLIDQVAMKDDDIFNLMIDNTSLETQVVVNNDAEAQFFTSDERNVPRNCSVVILKNEGDTYIPSPNYKTYAGHLRPCRYFQVSVDDLVRDLEQEMEPLKAEKEAMRERLNAAQLQVRTQTQEVTQETANMANTRRQLESIERQMQALKDAEEPEPEDIRVYEEDIAKNEAVMEEQRAKKVEIQQRNIETKIAMDAAEEEYRKVTKKMDFICGENSAKNRLEDAQTKVRDLCSKIAQYKDRKSKMDEVFNRKKEEWLSVVRAAEDDATTAAKICPRLEETRSLDVVETEMKGLQTYIKKRETMQGDENDIRNKYMQKRDKYVEMFGKFANFKVNVKKLEETITKRKVWYDKIRAHVTLSVQHWFSMIMRTRKFNGVLEIDHDRQTLQIRVNPHGRLEQNGNDDMLALSGGERSFTTVAFLLSLWDVAETPFRMMDEFDVFMDAANRTAVLDMLLRKAKQITNMQFVFLTPQALDIGIDEQIQIHKLPDPRST